MKKYLFFIAALFAVTQLSAQTPDTVKVIEQPDKVIITETPNGSKVTVMGSKGNETLDYTYSVEHAANDEVRTSQNDNDWELNFPFKKNNNNHFLTVVWSNLDPYFGAILHTSNPLVNNGFNWGFLNVFNINFSTSHGQAISFGVGYDSKRFSLKRPNCFVMDQDTRVVSTDFYPDGMKDRSSFLNVRAIQFPLTFQQNLGKDFYFTLGAALNWNVYGKCKTHFKEGDISHDLSYHKIKFNKITCDVIGALYYDALGIYCRYSPCNVFKKDFGPEIKNAWTLGITIGFESQVKTRAGVHTK